MGLLTEPHHLFDADIRLQYADRLRLGYENQGKRGYKPSPVALMSLIDEVTEAVLPGNEDETPLLLADLIDPDVCGNTLRKDGRSFHCSKCDATVQTNEMIVPAVSSPYGMRVDMFRYCPYCGRKIEDSKTSFSLVK